VGPPPKAGSLADPSLFVEPEYRKEEEAWSAEAAGQTGIDPELHNKVKWGTLVRILVVSLMLAATIVLQGERGGVEVFSADIRIAIYVLCMGMYFASAIYVVLLFRLRQAPHLALLMGVQLAGDLLFSLGIVLYTGGTGSVFTFFFSLAVVTAGLVLYMRGAFVVATGAFLCFLFMGSLEFSLAFRDVVRPILGELLVPIALENMDSRTTGYNIAVNGIAFYAIAFLSSYLSEQLKRTSQRLVAQASTLENLEELFDNILTTIPTGVITTDSNGNITFVNPEAALTCELDSTEILGRPVSQLFPDLLHIMANRRKHGRAVSEITTQLIGREPRLLRWTITPLKQEESGVEGELLIFEDVTNLVTLQQAMQENRHLAAIGELAAGVAHEIRNPLGAISGCAQMLAQEGGPASESDDHGRLLGIILRETEQLNRWIGEFLSYARPRDPKKKNFDLMKLVRDTVQLSRNDPKMVRTGGEITCDGPDSLYFVGDPEQLQQVLWNLIRNAQEALSGIEDGIVHISARLIEEATDLTVELSVMDNGGGIATKDQPMIFAPFYTTRDSGTGLGLATVQRIVQNHGGEVKVHSVPGAGAKFEILLPLR